QIAGTWKLCPIGGGRLLQGNYSGLYVLEQHNGHWRVKHKIEGFDNSSKSFEIYKNNTIFVNHEYKGVFILEVDSDFKKLIHLRQSKNVEKGLHSGLVLYNNNIVYANRKGVYRYVEEKEDFVREDQLSAFYDSKNYTSGKLINTHNSKTLWSFSKKHLAFTESNNLIEGLRIKTVPIPEKIRKGAAGYENIVHLNANSYLIGRNNGYLLFNKQKWKQEENIDFEIRIDR
ncbi:MAG: LuxR family transcriptional regulator, partial [Flavobacteriaceae bacterium]|nr:LuxR family transcriptional regulator [Flavobacteriaceae bacterium]